MKWKEHNQTAMPDGVVYLFLQVQTEYHINHETSRFAIIIAR